MVSNPLFILSYFFLHFPKELSYGYLRFEGNGKIPLGRQGKGRKVPVLSGASFFQGTRENILHIFWALPMDL